MKDLDGQNIKIGRRYKVIISPCIPNRRGLPSIENGAHGTEKLLLKTQESEDFAQ